MVSGDACFRSILTDLCLYHQVQALADIFSHWDMGGRRWRRWVQEALRVPWRTMLRLTRGLRSCLQGNLPDEHSFIAYFAQRGRERPSEKEIKETETQSEGMGEGRERGKEIEKKSGSDDFQMGQKTQTHTHT